MLENAVEAGFSMKPAQYLQRPLKYEGNIGDNTLIIPLSYCWASKEHADPELRTIKQVVRFLKYLIKTRHYKDARSGRTLGIGDQKPLLFLDYMSLPQKAGGRTFLDLQQFELGRKCVGILYAHAKTMTLLGTMTHENHEDGPLGRTEFFESGWPFFECQVAGLGKRPDMIYDLTVSLKWIDENFTESPYPRHQSNQSLFFLQEANRRKTTALPMNKRDFSTRVMDLNFMNSADRIFVDGKYAETSDEILGGLKELLREDTPLASAEDWKILLVETMPGYCKCLVNVNLSNNDKIQDVTLSSFESIAGTLEHLNLRNCPGFRGSLEPLMKCKKLKVLQMSGCLQIAGGLDWLEGLEELEEVDLECCFRLTGAILPLAGLEKLKVLNVCDTALGGSNGRSSGGSIDVSPDDAAVVAVTTQNMDAVLDQNVDVFVAAFQAAKKGEQCTIGRYGDAWKTPLWRAANSGQVLTIQMLLEGVQRKAGGKERMMVDVNAPGINSGDTALIQAARVGNVTAVRVLVKDYKADVDRTNKEGATPLIVAAQAGHATIVRALVKEFGADVDKAILSTGVTALMLGAKYGQKKVVKMLVEEGVDVDRASADTGATSLIDAAEEGHTDVVRVLLEKGKADVDKARTDNGATPLVLASQNGHLEVVRALVRDFGADVEARTDDGSTPLILAAENGRLTVVRVLLEDGKADVNKARTDNGATPLILASQNGHLEVVRDLLQYNADASKVLRSNGVTPLFAAAQEGHAEVVRVLLEDGKADVNKAMASTGATPLFGAAQAGHLEVVRVLLEGGKADVDKADSTGLTPVCRAAQAGRLDVVRLLLRHGADHTTTEKRSGRTPLQWAQANGRSEVAAVLKKHLTLRQLTSTDESSTPRKQKATSPHKASLLKAELPKSISSQKAARSRYLFHEMPPVL
jgi:ankyrin repeat protein